MINTDIKIYLSETGILAKHHSSYIVKDKSWEIDISIHYYKSPIWTCYSRVGNIGTRLSGTDGDTASHFHHYITDYYVVHYLTQFIHRLVRHITGN